MPGLSAATSRFLAQRPVFRLEEFRTELGEGRSPVTVRNRLQQFLASGRLRLLSPGVYAVTPPGEDARAFTPDPLLVASRLTRDSVLAYHSAFEALGFANQVFTQATYLTAGHRRSRRLEAHTFVALPPPRPLGDEWEDIGVETVQRQGLALRTTGRERTLVDCLDRPRYSGGLEELFACVSSLPSLDFGLLERYLAALGSLTLYARAGFVLQRFADRLFVERPLLDRLAVRLPKVPAYLLRREPGNVLVREWRLLVPPALLRDEESPLR